MIFAAAPPGAEVERRGIVADAGRRKQSRATRVMREFTVAVFVVHQGAVLLHWHRKLGRWLPPGGHVEPDELPDEAAIRETLEEAGIEIELLEGMPIPGVSDQPALQEGPRRLAQPLGIQLEDIPANHPTHQHVDLIYLARPRPGAPTQPRAPADDPDARPAWYAAEALGALELTEEVRRWALAAVAAARTAAPAGPVSPAGSAGADARLA